nr:retrovirus-related Pol polyprotein from transposon TNT 1-94 [Tanacetum cinerariifolium]
MLSGSVFSKQYWTESVATTCYTQNRSTIMKRHLKTPYEIFRKRIPSITFLQVFGCPVYIYNHKDHLVKFDEKADDGYLLGYSLVSKAFRVFNTRRQYLPDEYLHPYEPYQRYQTNNNDVSFIEPYESPEPVVLEIEVSSDQNGQTDQNDQTAQSDEIFNDNMSEHSTEAEYVAATGCCAKILWMKTQLTNYDIIYEKVPIFCNNTSAIAISNNPVLHSRTKHIDIRYHFIRDHILKGDIKLHFTRTQYQLADIFTKPLDEPTFKRLIVKLVTCVSFIDLHEHLWICRLRWKIDDDEGYWKRILKKRTKTKPKTTKPKTDWKRSKKTKLFEAESKKSKPEQYVAMSSADAEYVAATGCCAKILWMKTQLTNYDIIYEKVPIFCDNTSAIVISNNPVLHTRTKHIDIRYHFIRDHILKGDIKLHFTRTQYQLADIFTKPLDEPTFKKLIVKLGMLNIHSKPEALVLSEED